MVKFTPRELPAGENPNVTSSTPFRDFCWLAGTIFVVLFSIYVIFSGGVSLLLHYHEEETVAFLAPMISEGFERKHLSLDESLRDEQELLEKILKKMTAHLPEDDDTNYRIIIVPSEDMNAIAVPGGLVVFYSKLVEEAESENELAMIVGHELGHYANKDYLHGLSRGATFVVLSSLLGGDDSAIGGLFGGALSLIHHSHSREQEREADSFGLDLLNKSYGHVGGATSFFEKLRKKEWKIVSKLFATTHPVSSERIQNIKRWTKQRGYKESL